MSDRPDLVEVGRWTDEANKVPGKNHRRVLTPAGENKCMICKVVYSILAVSVAKVGSRPVLLQGNLKVTVTYNISPPVLCI